MIVCAAVNPPPDLRKRKMELTHLSLFSGIGGLDIAAEAAGFQTVGQCEWADYPTKVLEKHWPDVPRWRDIRTLTGDDFYARTGRRPVTVISGGFPCQPFSVAGKRRGKEDDRYLWPEMCRVISEIRPAWVIGENVPGIVNLALDTVLSDLESQGYACQTFIIPAAGVDAPHRRERICIVGWYSGSGERKSQCKTGEIPQQDSEPSGVCADVSNTDAVRCDLRGLGGERVQRADVPRYEIDSGCKNVAYTESTGFSSCIREGKARQSRFKCSREDASDSNSQQCERSLGARNRRAEFTDGGWWPAEPDVGRVANGIPSRVDRLKCLGNAVVPAQFYPFFKYIAEIERRIT